MRTRVTGRFASFSDFELEAYLCMELSPERRAAIDRAAEVDAALSAYLVERAEARAQFAAAHPLRLPSRAAAPARARAWQQARRWLLLPAVAAPALVFALWWSAGTQGARSAAGHARDSAPGVRDTIRVKGPELAVRLYVKRGEFVFQPRPDEVLKPGDRVRLSVDSARTGYLSVLSRDERGAVSVYYDQLPVQPGRFTVPDSLVLDAATSDEVWLVVLAAQPQPAARYSPAFAAGRAPDDTHVLLTVRKEKP
jgi:hypothetical protein